MHALMIHRNHSIAPNGIRGLSNSFSVSQGQSFFPPLTSLANSLADLHVVTIFKAKFVVFVSCQLYFTLRFLSSAVCGFAVSLRTSPQQTRNMSHNFVGLHHRFKESRFPLNVCIQIGCYSSVGYMLIRCTNIHFLSTKKIVKHLHSAGETAMYR